MNPVNSFFKREQGFLSNDYNYDFVLRRLSVSNVDSWRGILPSSYSQDCNPEPPIFSAKFANCEGNRHILAIANEDGKIALQDITKKSEDLTEKSLTGVQCHFNAVFDLEWVPGQMKLVSASGDRTASLWEIDGAEIRNIRKFNGHKQSVKTAAFRRNDSSVFATGGRDGAIIIWDTRAKLNIDLTARADNCIYSGHSGGPITPVSQKKKLRTPKLQTTTRSSSITGLVFQDNATLVSCGAGDGVIKVWDMRRNYSAYKKEPLPKHSFNYAGSSSLKGFTNLIVDESGSKLYANCMDNTIYCYNLFSYSNIPLATYTGLRNDTFYIKSCLSPDGKYLISGSSDEKAYIWNLNYSEPIISLCGHTVEVTCVAWCSSYDQPIVTCSDDARHKVWRIELECTPRSLKRIVEQNETTPNSIEKISTKRHFTEMIDGDNDNENMSKISEIHNHKRMKTTEMKGRCLFGEDQENSKPEIILNSEQIDENQNSLLSLPLSATSTVTTYNKSTTTSTTSLITTTVTSLMSSPTTNLPNYVLSGYIDAPHLGIMSPKRKTIDKIDWLTKIRKQKLMKLNLTSNISDKISDDKLNFNLNNDQNNFVIRN